MTAETIVAAPVLAVSGATKLFGAVVALDGVDLEVHAGEVLALLGDNGAGKSTLIKCISGVHKLDKGEIRIDGAPVQHRLGHQAREFGIETVYQDLALFDNLEPDRKLLCWPRGCRPRVVTAWSAMAQPARDDDAHPGIARSAASAAA